MTSILNKREVSRARSGPRELKDPRSKEYAIQTLYALKRYAESLKCDQDLVQKELAEIDRYQHWLVLGYESKEAMLAAELSDVGLTRVQAAAERPKVLGDHGTNQHRGEREGLNNVKSNSGPTAEYYTARIARDRPDILKRMKDGEFKSVRSAAIEAGIVKPDSPLVLLKRAWNKANAKERREFQEWLLSRPEVATKAKAGDK